MMKNIIFILFGVLVIFTSCNDWLNEDSPGVTKVEDFFTSGMTGVHTVNAAYSVLAWDLGNTYIQDWFIGDIMSDDALKGGESESDNNDVLDMLNFKTNTNNTYLRDYYRAQFQGIGRANLAIEQIPNIPSDSLLTDKMRNRLIGEARFLRGFYYFKLVRVFGKLPIIDAPIYSANDWIQERASIEQVYEFIIDDFLFAEKHLWNKSEYDPEDLGRATKGAAQAMLLKSYLYTKDFVEAEKWGAKLKQQGADGEYSLCENYKDNFTLEGENGPESIFEIQYITEGTSSYGDGGFGFSRGTFSTILMRPRTDEYGGWGFNRPSVNLYNAFDSNDPRRDETILDIHSDDPEDMEYNDETFYLEATKYYNNKYCMPADENGVIYDLEHHSRGPLNYKLIRYADALLMYAEACVENNNLDEAKWALEEVRNRARGGDSSILPAFPNYNGYADNKDDLREAVRYERRVELAMEGHRWYDIVRWGIAKEVMDNYIANEAPRVRNASAPFIEGVHEIFPIPSDEVDLGKLLQNPGY